MDNTVLYNTLKAMTVNNYKNLVGTDKGFEEFFREGTNPGVYAFAVEHHDNDFQKIFKEAYFQCTNVEYDGDDIDNDASSGRVKALYFEEIKKKE